MLPGFLKYIWHIKYINYDAVIVSINIFTTETVPIFFQILLLSMTGILLKITDISSICW